MPKKKQIKKTKEKKKSEEKKKPEEKLEKKPEKDESGLEEDIKEADEELQNQKQVRFISQGKIVAPVLEQISEESEAPKAPEINWELSPGREEKKQEKKPEYHLEKAASSTDYEAPKQQEVGFNVPILRPERMNVLDLGRQREQIGREFTMAKPFETDEEEKEYEINIGIADDIDRLKVKREQIGREYKPKH